MTIVFYLNMQTNMFHISVRIQLQRKHKAIGFVIVLQYPSTKASLESMTLNEIRLLSVTRTLYA